MQLRRVSEKSRESTLTEHLLRVQQIFLTKKSWSCHLKSVYYFTINTLKFEVNVMEHLVTEIELLHDRCFVRTNTQIVLYEQSEIANQ